MKFITQTLAFIYVGSSTCMYFAHAEKSNIRGLQTSTAALSIETPVDELLESYVTPTSSLEKLPAFIEGEEEVNHIVDETETHSNRRRRVTKKSKKKPQPLDINDKRDVISHKSPSGSHSKSPSKKRRTKKHARDLGTVTDFNPIAKGAYPPVVETPVLVYEKSSGSGPSKGKGKGSSSSSGSYGGRYGYHHDGSPSSSSSSKGKGKGGRYSYREKRGTYKHEKGDDDCW